LPKFNHTLLNLSGNRDLLVSGNAWNRWLQRHYLKSLMLLSLCSQSYLML
jgi:hypothetical protein